MDVDCPATSRIAGQPNARAVDFTPTWRTLRLPLPKLPVAASARGYPESGDYHRLATGEAAS